MKNRVISFVLACVMLASMLPAGFASVSGTNADSGYNFQFTHAAHTTSANTATNTVCKFEDAARDPQIVHTIDTASEDYDAWGYVAQSFPNEAASTGTEGKRGRMSYYRPGKKSDAAVVFDPTSENVATALCLELRITKGGKYNITFNYDKYSLGPIVDLYLVPKPQTEVTNATLSDFVKALDGEYKIASVDTCGTDLERGYVDIENPVELLAQNYYFIMVANGESATAAKFAQENKKTFHYFLPVSLSMKEYIPLSDNVTLTYDFNRLNGADVNNVLLNTENAGYDNTAGTWEYTGVGVTWIKTQKSYGINIGTSETSSYAVLRLNIPYAGTYAAKLIHHMNASSGGKGDVYLLPDDADVTGIDEILANPEKLTVAKNVSYYNKGESIFDNSTDAMSVAVPEAGEYYLVFQATGSDSGTWGTYPHKLILSGKDTTGVAVMYIDAVLAEICVEAGKETSVSVSGYMTNGAVLSDSVTYSYKSGNEAVATVDANGKITTIAGGTADITVTATFGNRSVTDTTRLIVTNPPAPFSGVDAEYRFFERNAEWDPINNPVEGFPKTDRSEDVRGITYKFTGVSGDGNWQYNMVGPEWIPQKYDVFMYPGTEENPSFFLRLQLPENNDWIAFDIKVPAAGRYIAELLYSVYYRAASVSDIYVLPKDETTDTAEEITSLLTEEKRIGRADYLDASATDTYKAKSVELGSIEFDSAGEYLFVFRRNDNGRGGYVNPKKLTLYGVNGMHYANISADRTELNYGETANVQVTATRLDGSVVTPDSYKMSLESSNSSIVSVTDDGKIIAKGDGVATVKVKVVDNTGKVATSELTIAANDNTGIKETKLEIPSVIYADQRADTEWTATMKSENVLTVPPDSISYSYSTDGIVSIDAEGKITGLAKGSVEIQATATFKGEQISATVPVEVIVDDRKSEPTYYTYDMRRTVCENIEKYDWARDTAKSAVARADKYLEQYEYMYYSMPGEGIPITIRPGLKDEPDYKLCRYCGVDVIAEYGNGTTGGWIYDIVGRPWKIQCPECKRLFPSNDFESLYELGRDTAGYYSAERAREENEKLKEASGGKTDYLRNDLYPEIAESNRDPLRKDENGEYYIVDGATWGVDDGYGYRTGRTYKISDTVEIPEHHMYIGTYLWNYFGEVATALDYLSRAYVMTDDAKYGRAGAILMDRMADLFPSFDFSRYNGIYPSSDGGSGLGKLHGRIDDADYARQFALECDAFFPMLKDSQVIDFLSRNAEKWGLENKKSSPEEIWDNWEYGILDESFCAMKRKDIDGNFGMKQYALACAAIVRDREPVTSEMIEWIYATDTAPAASRECTGGSLMSKLVDVIDRDGMGDEAAPNYNVVWITRLYQVAEMLSLYKGEGDYNLYNNPKFTQMFTAFMPVFLTESHTVEIGDTGGVANMTASDGISLYSGALKHLRDTEYAPKLANYIYMRNGYTTEGLNYGIYEENPERLEDEVLELVDENYEQQSEIMTGFGFAVLRDGLKTKNATSTTAQNTLRDIWMYFGRTSGHGHLQMLNLGMDAYGLNVAPDTGYPELTGYQPNRWQWVRTTISHNTVTVNEKQQNQMTAAATPLHFEDAGKVKVMDIEAPGAYTETSEYRRCAVMVEVNDDVAYTVDFFRIKGGEQHTYSFHSQAENAYPADESINLTYQTEDGTPNTPYVGSYADVNWPVGEDPVSPTNTANYWTKYPRGYSWMDKVRYDKNLKTGKIAVEFDVRDYRKAITDSKGIKLRLTQLNDFVPDEVAIVGGYVPQSSRNTGLPKTLDYVLVHRKGPNLDTLFTTVLEPYKNTRYISEIDAVDITAIDGTEGDNDVARAVKVTHIDGRVDYIVYATNNAVIYNVADVFTFRGAVGVYSLNASGNVVYRYVTDGDIIGEATGSPANYSGTVAGYQRDLSFDNYIDVNMVCADIDSLAGKYIHIANDEIRNAVYRIDSASENKDGTIRLDIGTVSLIRGHNDVTDFDSGYVYDIQNNQKFTIPMSFADENLPMFDEVSSSLSTSAGSAITIGIKAKSPIDGMRLSYDALIFPRGASINSATGVVTWKPDSSQVGDNHFAVTARDSDGRESTIHFTVTVYGSTTAGTVDKAEEDEAADSSGNSGETTTPSGGGGGGGAAPADKPDDTTNTDETDEDESLLLEEKVPSAGEADDVEKPQFTDLGNHAWAADAINTLATDGIIKGTSASTFSPEANITRADFALLLVRAFKLESDNAENFADVSAADYFAPELAIARNTGIVNGIGDNKFAPRNTITRQDMMVIVHRALSKMGVNLEVADVDYADFEDVSNYAKDAVKALITSGLVNGKSGKIAPADYTTRAEVAVLLKRVISLEK
ncbi:MAG: S-layer homology domain-containing protein [Oscillospiraceae bacterium]|nr:S-layer homology domain-containing protein [Oscillospiraceae bacterium]